MTVSVTVAAVIERNGTFLVVEEYDSIDRGLVLNQPAGHVEAGEAILNAVTREAFEEAGVQFVPEFIVGIYQLAARNGRDYVRIAFGGHLTCTGDAQPHDKDIVACYWYTREQIANARPRSGLVLQCIDDYRSGKRFDLGLLHGFCDERPTG